MPVMNAGRFAGRPVAELPDWYLYALVERRLTSALAAAVARELELRALRTAHHHVSLRPPVAYRRAA